MFALAYILALEYILALAAGVLVLGQHGPRADPPPTYAEICSDPKKLATCIIASDSLEVVGAGIQEHGKVANVQGSTFYLVDDNEAQGTIRGCNGSATFTFVNGIKTFDASKQAKNGKIAGLWLSKPGNVATHSIIGSSKKGDDLSVYCH